MSKPEPLTEQRIKKLESQIKTLHTTLASWRKAGIPEKTLVVLLSHYTKVPQGTIRRVIEGFDNLYEEYFTEDE
tara:strand:+ start:1664 stop:1885 length:222 start_codon:yes stop_codon:yes gene_type:complete